MRNLILGMSLMMMASCQSTDPDLHPLTKPDFSEATPPALMTQNVPNQSIRFATYNTSLYSEDASGLIKRLQNDDAKAKKIAAVIQHQRPDILLLNEFDYDSEGKAATIFRKNFLEKSQDGQTPISYPYVFFAPVNTGVQSGMDLDNNGTIGGEGRSRGNDAFGYGLHPGQYGMLVLSQFPIDVENVRTFQHLLWKDLPGAIIPMDPVSSVPWYKADVWARLRLSSKSHWDVPIQTSRGMVHFLVSHPTPPVFDGPENRNGARNHDEIKLWAEYLSNEYAQWLCDDKGICGGLAAEARFVIAGDLNSDPVDGDSLPSAMSPLLNHPRVLKHVAPTSKGAVASSLALGQANLNHKGNPAEDTGAFNPKVGNMRLDYVLPSSNTSIKNSGVFWQKTGELGDAWMDASDHHMVWVDLEF